MGLPIPMGFPLPFPPDQFIVVPGIQKFSAIGRKNVGIIPYANAFHQQLSENAAQFGWYFNQDASILLEDTIAGSAF